MGLIGKFSPAGQSGRTCSARIIGTTHTVVSKVRYGLSISENSRPPVDDNECSQLANQAAEPAAPKSGSVAEQSAAPAFARVILILPASFRQRTATRWTIKTPSHDMEALPTAGVSQPDALRRQQGRSRVHISAHIRFTDGKSCLETKQDPLARCR